MFKSIMNNMKIGKSQSSSSNSNNNSNIQTKKDKNNQLNTNTTQILTLHQQQQQLLKQQQTLQRAQSNQRPPQPLPNQNGKNFNQPSLLSQNQPIQIQHQHSQNQNLQSHQQAQQQQRTNTLNPQQQNTLAQHYANIQNQLKLQQQQQQVQQNRNLLSNSNTLSNLNQNNANSISRGINGLAANSISNSLSTSAISNNLPMNENSTLNRQLITDPNAIYSRTFTVANQPIYNSNHMIKPIMNNFVKGNQIYGQAQLNATNNNIIYGRQTSNQNLFKDVNSNQASIFSANNQFPIADLNQAINLNQSINSNNKWNLFDEDPGIMSEVETSSTGFRRMNKIRSSLPIVRTMSKTSDRSLGLVFLQYQNETKRSLLPNEITSFDTVKALFVRSFPRQLTMDYFEDKNNVRIYIHDQTKDMFYELEDLKDIKDRSILRVYEHDAASGSWIPAGSNNILSKLPNGTIASNAIYGQRPSSILGFHKNDDLNYFSEPEFDTGFNQHNNMHKKRLSATFANNYGSVGKNNLISCSNNSQYYGTIVIPAQQRQEILAKHQQQKKQLANISSTLPRGTHLISTSNIDNLNTNSFKESTPPPKPQRSFNSISATQPCTIGPSQNMLSKLSYSISGNTLQQSLNANNMVYDRSFPDRPYSVAGHYALDTQLSLVPPIMRSIQNNTTYLSSPERKNLNFISNTNETFAHSNESEADTKIMMKMMEKKIENLTGLVQNALKPSISKDQQCTANGTKPKLLNKQKVSFDLKKNEDLFCTFSDLQNKAKNLNYDLNELRKLVELQKQQFNEFANETKTKIYNRLSIFNLEDKQIQFRLNRFKLTKEENVYRNEVVKLEKDLNELELNVEKLRANVISRRCRVNMTDVESMAFNLSRASKNVSELKSKFPDLQNNLKIVMTKEMQVVVDEEKFLKEEPDRLENALKRCKKLTGTLVTLKRLASVQEQRSSANKGILEKCSSTDSTVDPENGKNSDATIQLNQAVPNLNNNLKQENVLDSLLDELQTFTNNNSFEYQKKTSQIQPDNQNRINSNDLKLTQKQPIIQQNLQQKRSLDLGKKNVPSPPPRSSSSKINDQKQDQNYHQPETNNEKQINNQLENEISKVSICGINYEISIKQARPKSTPPENNILDNQLNNDLVNGSNKNNLNSISNQLIMVDNLLSLMPSMSTSSLSSVGSQDSVVDNVTKKNRQQLLEERHQDLLKKQKLLQEQYIRLQQLSRGELPKNILNELKKTGSESNLFAKDKTQNLNGVLSNSIHENLKLPVQNVASSKVLTSPKKAKLNGVKSNDFLLIENLTNGNVKNSNITCTKQTQKVYETDLI